MRTRWGIVAVCLLLLALVAGSGAFAADKEESLGRWGVPTDSSGAVLGSLAATSAELQSIPPERRNQLLVVRTRPDQEEFVDVDEEDFSDGDYVVFTERIFNEAGNRRIGVGTARCTFIFERDRCDGTFTIRGRGDIEVAGTMRFDPPTRRLVLAVTGGTKNFRRVGGDAELLFPGGQDIIFVFRLRR